MSPVTPTLLEDAMIRSLPPGGYYIPNFISPEEEETLLGKIEAAPKPRWKQLAHRRLQTWPSDLTADTLLQAPLPNWLVEPSIARILRCPVSRADPQSHIFSNSSHGAPNHVLINQYQSGEGIMPHKDGAAYHPVVCTVSLGSSLILDIYGTNEDGSREAEPRFKILQEPRSLLITTGELYTDYLHGIAEVYEDNNLSPDTVSNWELLGSPGAIVDGTSQRSMRTSLTYRDVNKVVKLGTKFAMFGRS